MGNVSSRPEDGGVLVLRDQSRLSIVSLTVTNAKGKVLLNVVPNVYPATRVIARKDYGDDSLVEYIQVKAVLSATQTAGSLDLSFRIQNLLLPRLYRHSCSGSTTMMSSCAISPS